MIYIVTCKKCGQDLEISALDRADMLINGGWIAHGVCPRDLPRPDSPSMNLLHPERLGLFEWVASLFKRNEP